ncbi:GNAT family N-acetyltransferase [Bacteroides propionicifaciens]|uniref:GNAT family N-acetyltransferase n=1 Tax=Bacteroides propionicifaciens TaxID=392838 RepID=UPI00036BD1DA|nr:GNAT family N-acetyltransferase [Bacteroides propionicifaciens]
MEKIIDAVDKNLIKAELTEDKRLRMTNKSQNQIYIITYQDSPNVMREIGRLREIAFRAAGGGTGKAVDIDEFDEMENAYKQLLVWDPESEEILGGYRYILGTDVRIENGVPQIATSHLFNFSSQFISEYLPTTIELGRSFVTLEYQSTRAGRKGLFALDNLWDGLGALTVIMPTVKYFFGKVTMYPSYHKQGRDMILYFLKKHFADKENLITPIKPLEIESDEQALVELFNKDSFSEDYRILNKEIRQLGFNIPPLVNAYMGLSPTMKMFGTAVNYGFGDVEETGILIAVDEILEDKRVRHIQSFVDERNGDYGDLTSGANNVIFPIK